MSREDLDRALAAGHPYFGAELAARQGAPRRHAYMRATVRHLVENGMRSPLILEVGSWAGGSAVTWGRALERWADGGTVVCVDHWSAYWDLSRNADALYQRMDRAAREEEILPLFLHNIRACGLERRVIPVRGCSRGVLAALPDGWFDLAYIDGSHLHDDVRGDIADARRLVRDGGILCGDDLELQLSETDIALVERLADERRDFVLYPGRATHFHPGVTLAVGRAFGDVACWDGFWGMKRRGDDWAAFELSTVDPGWPEHLGGP